jgi:hypothetical protein
MEPWEERRHWLRVYVRSNFVPPLPEAIGDLASKAIDALEIGASLYDTVTCEDMSCMPNDAEIVPAIPGIVPEMWRIGIGDLLWSLRLENSVSEETLRRLNDEEGSLPLAEGSVF